MRIISFVFALSALLLFAGEYEINVHGIGKAQKVLAIELTGKDLANLGGHTDWIRLYDRDGNVVPWALQRHYTTDYAKSRVKYPFKLTLVKHDENDGSLMVEGEVDTDEPLPEKLNIVFNTKMKDFEQIVSILGLGEGNRCRYLLNDGFIFDSTSNIAVRNVALEFNPLDYRRFRICFKYASLEKVNALRTMSRQWSDFGGGIMRENREVLTKSFKIDSLELFSEQLVQSGTIPAWEKVECSFENDPKNNLDGNSSYVLALPAYPVSGIHFRCKEENYSREIKIFHVDEAGRERLLVNGRISHINLGRLLDETYLNFNDSINSGKLRVVCANKDNPKLTFLSMEARIPAYRLRFLASSEMMPLKLSSTAGAKAPAYDTSALLAFGERNPEDDSIVHLKDFRGEIPKEIKRSRGMPRVALFIVLGLVVLAMGAAIVSTARKI